METQQEAARFSWFDDLYVYDTKTKAWSQPVQLSMGKPSARCACSMVAYKEMLGKSIIALLSIIMPIMVSTGL